MKIYTSQFRYGGDDRLDVTVKSGEKAFAPTWHLVRGIKLKTISEEEYVGRYKNLMNKSYNKNKEKWKELLSKDRVTLVCYCGSGQFCHRVLLAEMMAKAFDCEYMGEIDHKTEHEDANKIITASPDGLCLSCKEEGFDVELYKSENLERCLRCMGSTVFETIS